MAASFTVDQITNLSMVEQRGENNGVIFELRREALVTGLNPDILKGGKFRILQEALDTLPASSGVGFGDAPIGNADLILVERVVRLIPGERTKCIVELVYKRQFSSLDTLEIGVFIPRGGAGLRQFTTGKDAFGNNIVVRHTYPDKCAPDPCQEAPGYPYTDTSLVGATAYQGGEVQVDYPSDTLEFEGRLVAQSPGTLARSWRGHTNDAVWNGGDIGTWRCAEVPFYPYDIAPTIEKVWVFNFLFQFDPTGWNPDAIFRDQLTGLPPPVLVDGESVVEVDWYPTRNFAELFPP